MLPLSEGCAVNLPLPDGMDRTRCTAGKGATSWHAWHGGVPSDYLSYRIRQAASRPHTDTAAINETLGEIGLLSSPLAVYRRIGELSGATGNTDRGTTAGNLRRHRPEKRTGTGAEEGERRPSARPAEKRTLLRFASRTMTGCSTTPTETGFPCPHGSPANWRTTSFPEGRSTPACSTSSPRQHPDGIADERLSALVLSLRASPTARYRGRYRTNGFQRDPLPSAPLRRVLAHRKLARP